MGEKKEKRLEIIVNVDGVGETKIIQNCSGFYVWGEVINEGYYAMSYKELKQIIFNKHPDKDILIFPRYSKSQKKTRRNNSSLWGKTKEYFSSS